MPADEDQPSESAVENRWWVDTSEAAGAGVAKPVAKAGSRFFRAGIGYEQNRARDRLTDNNRKILLAADPPEGGWSYVRLAEKAHPDKEQERIRKALAVPPYARAVLVDSGRVVRVLLTGTPIADRILEFSLGYAPSFDCWVADEWVEERVFKNPGEVLKAAPRLIRRYLSPESIARDEAVAPRV